MLCGQVISFVLAACLCMDWSRPESVKDLGGQKLEAVLLPSTIDADSDTGKDRTAASFLDRLVSSAHAAEVSWRDMPSRCNCSISGCG